MELLSLNFYGIAIRNKKGEIISLAKEDFKGTLCFGIMDNDEDFSSLEVSLHESELKAKRSFTAKASKGSYEFSDELKELLHEEYGLIFNENLLHTCIDYSQIKNLVSFVSLKVTYDEI